MTADNTRTSNGNHNSNHHRAKGKHDPSIEQFITQSGDSFPPATPPVPRQRKASEDSKILVRFKSYYQETGYCSSLSILGEIAHLARSGKLILPKEARKLVAESETIAKVVAEQVASLSCQLDEIENKCLSSENPINDSRQCLTIHQSLSLTEGLEMLSKAIEQIINIARDYPYLAVPGEEEGSSTAFIPANKLINDLYYNLAYLQEHTRRDRFLMEIDIQNNLSFYVERLISLLGNTQLVVTGLLQRLRCNMTHYIPSLAQQ